MSVPTDDRETWEHIIQGTFLKAADVAEGKGMAAAIESSGDMWDFSERPDQFARSPKKKQQLLAMDPGHFAAMVRAWAHAFTSGRRPHFGGLSDEQLATINIPALLFSGWNELHPQHTTEALHAKLPQSRLVITTEYYAETLDQIIRLSEEQGGEYFDAAVAGQIDEFVRSLL